jgi:hypothetical protein
MFVTCRCSALVIEIVDLPIENGDFFIVMLVYQRVYSCWWSPAASPSPRRPRKSQHRDFTSLLKGRGAQVVHVRDLLIEVSHQGRERKSVETVGQIGKYIHPLYWKTLSIPQIPFKIL